MGAHTHKKENNSDRARREKLKQESKKTRGMHGEGKVKPNSRNRPVGR